MLWPGAAGWQMTRDTSNIVRPTREGRARLTRRSSRRHEMTPSPACVRLSHAAAQGRGHSILASRCNLVRREFARAPRARRFARARSWRREVAAISRLRRPKIGSNAFPCILLWRLLEAGINLDRPGRTDRQRTDGRTVRGKRDRDWPPLPQNNPINKQ